MRDQEKQTDEQPQGQELGGEQLEQVNGGILIGLSQPALPAVQKVRQVLGDGSVVPTDPFSLNFTKK